MKSNLSRKKGHILVVDDTPANLQLLTNLLTEQGYYVRPVPNGRLALSGAQAIPPDLILLDIRMPDMDGYAVCEQLKADQKTSDIPVIFLSALNETEDLLRGFKTGCVDYITKPFNTAELLARVHTHLSLKKAYNQLQQMQLQLVQSEKMASLGTLVAGVAHEMNNPTSFIYTTTYNLKNNLSELKQFIFDLAGEDANEKFTQIFEGHFERLERNVFNISEGSNRIKNIVKDLRTFSRLDEAEQKRMNVVDGIRSTLNLIQTQYKKEVLFLEDFQVKPEIIGWPAELNQVYMNVIVNACQAIIAKQKETGEEIPGKLWIRTFHLGKTENEQVGIQFEDTGLGMSKEIQSRIFDPFFTTKKLGEGTGLGMSISYGIIEKHKGTITVHSEEGKGTTVTLLLPKGDQ